jgi:hypothetical protein
VKTINKKLEEMYSRNTFEDQEESKGSEYGEESEYEDTSKSSESSEDDFVIEVCLTDYNPNSEIVFVLKKWLKIVSKEYEFNDRVMPTISDSFLHSIPLYYLEVNSE